MEDDVDDERMRPEDEAAAPTLATIASAFPEVSSPITDVELLDGFAEQLRVVFQESLQPFKIDMQSLFPGLNSLNSYIVNQNQALVASVEGIYRAQFAKAIAGVAQLVESLLPPNWKGASRPSQGMIDRLLLDEGLCMAWVPPAATLTRLFAAPTAQARRQVIGSSWKRIADASMAELEHVTSESLRPDVTFASEAIESVISGHHAAGQALATNLLDSLLQSTFSKKDRGVITNQKARFELEGYPLRLALVLGGIWGAHREYWPSNGDRVPHVFSRHATVHGVSRRQYSRVNATISIMHVTALLRVLQEYAS